jgi:malate dehydrogenase (oxaloacetate-decarboxylating)(NADP+)
MFLAAAQALAGSVTDDDLALGRLYPPLSRLRAVSLDIAVAVADIAYRNNLARSPRPLDLRACVSAERFEPIYQTL